MVHLLTSARKCLSWPYEGEGNNTVFKFKKSFRVLMSDPIYQDMVKIKGSIGQIR